MSYATMRYTRLLTLLVTFLAMAFTNSGIILVVAREMALCYSGRNQC